MDRKDHELRMLSVRLPPYNQVMSRGIERIGNLTIEEEFVEDLRSLSVDGMSARLNSSDKLVRVRPAADVRCFISLVDHVTKRTRFRKEVRLLKVHQTLQEFFHSTSDLKEARNQAENFLNRRLRRLFPDMSPEETTEIQQRGVEMIDTIEQNILEERRSEIEAKRNAQAEKAKPEATQKADGDDELELTDDEKQRGVQIGRVEMRVAGASRRVPYKVMPDPEDGRFMIVQRDPDTGELVPQMRRGAKRYVEKDREGIWQLM